MTHPITQNLLTFGMQMDMRELFPTLETGATDFAIQNPYAFCLATCLDRGTKADIILAIPYSINHQLGHLDPNKIIKFSIE
jgi:hypothetical protein